MNRAYWDSVAADYERSVLSVFDHDREGAVCARIAAAGAARPGGRAADLGCGVGKFLPALARAFAQVVAVDHSPRGLEEARREGAALANVTFHAHDLVREDLPFPPVDFVLCVNVLLMPDPDERLLAWRAVTNQVDHGGTLLLVVPALEAVLFRHFCAVDACLNQGDSGAEALRRNVPAEASPADVHQGVHELDGLRTKHYLREEVAAMVTSREFDLIEIRKLEYPSYTSGVAPWPWDWLVVARRR